MKEREGIGERKRIERERKRTGDVGRGKDGRNDGGEREMRRPLEGRKREREREGSRLREERRGEEDKGKGRYGGEGGGEANEGVRGE